MKTSRSFTIKLLVAASMLMVGESFDKFESNLWREMNNQDVLNELDSVFLKNKSQYVPDSIKYERQHMFFLDLEDGYLVTANSRIHLFADSNRWAVVFETTGYHNRRNCAIVTLKYIGNCIQYKKNETDDNTIVANMVSFDIIDECEFEAITSTIGNEDERFELIDPAVRKVRVREQVVNFTGKVSEFEKLDIFSRSYDNPKGLIGFEGLVRYLTETKQEMMKATENELATLLPNGLPHIMTLTSFHNKSNYEKGWKPSTLETYQLISKVLESKDTSMWRPTLKPNNHWSNWASGEL